MKKIQCKCGQAVLVPDEFPGTVTCCHCVSSQFPIKGEMHVLQKK